MTKKPELSVIIPIALGDNAWRKLLADLVFLPDTTELVFLTHEPHAVKEALKTALYDYPHQILTPEKQGRAAALNEGGEAARGSILWFLHADSRFREETVSRLFQAIRTHARVIHYHWLAFLPDGTGWMQLNALGANLRSCLLGVPFGDQGFCIRKDIWEEVGRYPEDVPYGEDHVFVWRARQKGVPVRVTQGTVYTSARKYRKKGWWAVTAQHQFYWLKQAAPECVKWLSALVAQVFRR